uniref:Uncharacterized protein n=1 Tax=viral metagenome TaxID=1070528 RepID=A0A6M3LNE1_9ZZZZ
MKNDIIFMRTINTNKLYDLGQQLAKIDLEAKRLRMEILDFIAQHPQDAMSMGALRVNYSRIKKGEFYI